MPTRRPGAAHVAPSRDGAALDVDLALATIAARPAPTYAPPASSVGGDKYVAAALERECRAVASSANGGRNVTLNKAAHSLARLNLPSHEIEAALLGAAKSAGLPEVEARKTIRKRALRARRGERLTRRAHDAGPRGRRRARGEGHRPGRLLPGAERGGAARGRRLGSSSAFPPAFRRSTRRAAFPLPWRVILNGAPSAGKTASSLSRWRGTWPPWGPLRGRARRRRGAR